MSILDGMWTVRAQDHSETSETCWPLAELGEVSPESSLADL